MGELMHTAEQAHAPGQPSGRRPDRFGADRNDPWYRARLRSRQAGERRVRGRWADRRRFRPAALGQRTDP